MTTYLTTLGFDIWGAIKNGYTTPTNPPLDGVGKRLSVNNSKAMNEVLCGLEKLEFVKVMYYYLAKICGKSDIIYM